MASSERVVLHGVLAENKVLKVNFLLNGQQ
jgi:hypothetical protein